MNSMISLKQRCNCFARLEYVVGMSMEKNKTIETVRSSRTRTKPYIINSSVILSIERQIQIRVFPFKHFIKMTLHFAS